MSFPASVRFNRKSDDLWQVVVTQHTFHAYPSATTLPSSHCVSQSPKNTSLEETTSDIQTVKGTWKVMKIKMRMVWRNGNRSQRCDPYEVHSVP